MADAVTLRAGILKEAQAPVIRIGAIQQDERRTFRRRGGPDDIAEISSAGIRLASKPGSREPFEIHLQRDAIEGVRVERGWIEHHIWFETNGERHGLAFRRRTDFAQAVAAVQDVLGIVPR